MLETFNKTIVKTAGHTASHRMCQYFQKRYSRIFCAQIAKNLYIDSLKWSSYLESGYNDTM